MRRILVATDGSPAAEAAVEAGLALAREVGATVFAVAVGSSLPIWGDSYYARTITEEWSKLQLAVDDAVARARDLGVEATGELCEGHAVDAILTLADERDVDLVVIGSVRAAILGSVSRGVVGGSKVPVLVVPQPDRLRRVPSLVGGEVVSLSAARSGRDVD